MFRQTMTTIAALAFASAIALAQETGAPAAQKPAEPAPAAAPRTPPAQLVNVRIDLTVSEQRDEAAVAPRTVTMLVADREYGRVRASGTSAVNSVLNVDARPELTRDGRIKLSLTMEYRREGDATEKTSPALITQSMTVIVDDGKAMLISQSADPTAARRIVRVEVKATISK